MCSLLQLTSNFLFHNVFKVFTAYTMHDKYLREICVQASNVNMSGLYALFSFRQATFIVEILQMLCFKKDYKFSCL